MIMVFMIGSAALGFILAWLIKPSTFQKVSPRPTGNQQGNELKNNQEDLEKLRKKYESLYDSKLDVDTALMAAESTLDGLKMDYEKLERDLSGHNNRHKVLQENFDQYKDKKESEIKKLRTKTKHAVDNYETVKFQLAKSNRINEKLQESIHHLKDENEKLTDELQKANEEMEEVNTAMHELKDEFKELNDKSTSYNKELEAWEKKYKDLDINFQTLHAEKNELREDYDSYQSNTTEEIEKLTKHLSSLQDQLEESAQYASEYADAYSNAENEKKSLNVALEEQRKKAAEELKNIQKNVSSLESDYAAAQKRESLLDDRLMSLQNKHLDLEEAFNNTLDEKEQLEQKYKEYKESSNEKISNFEKDAASWLKKLEASDLELSQNKEKAKELEKSKKQLERELEKIKKSKQMNHAVSDDEFSALNETFVDLKQKYFELNKELSVTRLEKERIHHEHENYQEQIIVELDLIRKENKKLNKSLATLKAEKRMLEYQKEELETRILFLENNPINKGSDAKSRALLLEIKDLKIRLEDKNREIEVLRLEKSDKSKSIQSQPQLEVKNNGSTETVKTGSPTSMTSLQTINGIDSVKEEILNDFGIYDLKQLSNISEDTKELLVQVMECNEKVIKNWIKIAQSMLAGQKK